MMSEFIFCKAEIHNMPEDRDSHGFMVVRKEGKQLWYYGTYPVKERAEEVAVEIGNGIVLEV